MEIRFLIFIAIGTLQILGMLDHYLALLFKEILSQKDLTSQEVLLKRTENLNELTKEPTHLSPLK